MPPATPRSRRPGDGALTPVGLSIKQFNMVFTPEEVRKTMNRRSDIRNVAIITSMLHDKSTLMDCLVAAPGTQEIAAGDVCMAAVVDDANCENADFSLCYNKMCEEYEGEMQGQRYLINFNHPPGHIDIPSPATNALCVSDGALMVIDCTEGLCVHPQGLLYHALIERIRPVVSLNVGDIFFKPHIDGEEVYQILFRAIKNVNTILSNCQDKVLSDVKVCPLKGTVAFTSGLHGWGFTLRSIAQSFGPQSIDKEVKVMDNIWGDNFFDPATNEWTTEHTGSETCKRGFIKWCYEPIKQIIDNCMNGKKETLWETLKLLGVELKAHEMEFTGENLMKHVMQTYMPAGKALLEMIISHLPSPQKAQAYLVDNLYKGPLNDMYADAIRHCDPYGPLAMYISKTIPSSEEGRSVAFGRILSGRVASGMKVRIMGPDHVPGLKKDFYVQFLQETLIWMGKKKVLVEDVPSGNMVGLIALECIPEDNTLTNANELLAFPVRAISVAVQRGRIPDITFNPVGSMRMKFYLPYHVYDDLFPHQREGILWLWHMYCSEKGGILADDMGLGKTRQVAAFLCGMIHSKLIERTLIVCPPSVLDQWRPELEKVGIKNSKKFHSAKADLPSLNIVAKEGGVLLTTYHMFSKHEVSISGEGTKGWDYLFMDEGHRAKDGTKNIAKSLKRMNCNHKIVMTGTPLQNNLKEFYTLMDICNPSVLGDYNVFEEEYVRPIDRGKHRDSKLELRRAAAQASAHLQKLINPVVLRRTKELLKATGRLESNKYEYTIWLKLTPHQIKFYKVLARDPLLRVQGKAFGATDVFRDLCRHPFLLMPNKRRKKVEPETENTKDLVSEQMKKNLYSAFPKPIDPEDHTISSKVNFILYLVPKLIREGHKILIFSRSPQMLELLQNSLSDVMAKERIIRMDGSTKRRDRDKLRRAFQCENVDKSPESSDKGPVSSQYSDKGPSSSESCDSESSDSRLTSIHFSALAEPWVFLMTTPVGGVGLNLIEASRVIIVDPSENPSEDNQAVDRAYRIGQKKDVFVYRLVSCSTIEEHTYREQISKMESALSIMAGDQCRKAIYKKAKPCVKG